MDGLLVNFEWAKRWRNSSQRSVYDFPNTTSHIVSSVLSFQVWSPAGGWWSNPKHWKRNTGVAFAVVGVMSMAICRVSAAKERAPLPPVFHVPSQSWRKYAKVDDPSYK